MVLRSDFNFSVVTSIYFRVLFAMDVNTKHPELLKTEDL